MKMENYLLPNLVNWRRRSVYSSRPCECIQRDIAWSVPVPKMQSSDFRPQMVPGLKMKALCPKILRLLLMWSEYVSTTLSRISPKADWRLLEYNPQVYEDPYMFKPSRWEGVGEDGITSFGIGPRTCIGKKFAMTEAVCFLANLLRDWRIDPLLKAGETVDGWKSRVLSKTDITLTLSIATVPVNLIRR